MARSSVLAYLQSFIPGQRLIDGGDLLTMANYLFGTTTGITANTTGVAAAGTQLNPGWNRVDTAAVGGTDSVRLPPAIAGSIVGLWNNTGNSFQLFGQQANQGGLAAGDAIVPAASNNPAAVATGITITTNQFSIFVCFANGTWKRFLSA